MEQEGRINPLKNSLANKIVNIFGMLISSEFQKGTNNFSFYRRFDGFDASSSRTFSDMGNNVTIYANMKFGIFRIYQ